MVRKVEEAFYTSPIRKLGLDDTTQSRKKARERINARKAAQKASEELAKVRSAQTNARQEGLVKQSGVGPQIDVGQVKSNVPTTPENDSVSKTFKGVANLGGTRAAEKALKERVRTIREENPDISIRDAMAQANKEQMRSILQARNAEQASVDADQNRPPVPAGLQGGRFRDNQGNILSAEEQGYSPRTPEADISGPLSEQIKKNLALQSQQQAQDVEEIAAQRDVAITQAREAVEGGKVQPAQVNQVAQQVAKKQNPDITPALAKQAGDKAEKDFKLFDIDGKSALLATLGLGLTGVALAQDPRNAVRGIAAGVENIMDRNAQDAANAAEQENINRRFAQKDRELDISESQGIARLRANIAKLADKDKIKPSDRPTISEASATKLVTDFFEENLDDLNVPENLMNDLAVQVREQSKLAGGSPEDILKKLITEQYTQETDPGIFFDDTNLIKR